MFFLEVREDEMEELESLYRSYCELPVKGGPEHTPGKVNILLQAHIARAHLESFSLISDSAYVVKVAIFFINSIYWKANINNSIQNAGRIARGLFDLVLRQNWSLMIGRMLKVCKMIELQMWEFSHPIRQFFRDLNPEVLDKLERKNLSLEYIREADPNEIGSTLN